MTTGKERGQEASPAQGPIPWGEVQEKTALSNPERFYSLSVDRFKLANGLVYVDTDAKTFRKWDAQLGDGWWPESLSLLVDSEAVDIGDGYSLLALNPKYSPETGFSLTSEVEKQVMVPSARHSWHYSLNPKEETFQGFYKHEDVINTIINTIRVALKTTRGLGGLASAVTVQGERNYIRCCFDEKGKGELREIHFGGRIDPGLSRSERVLRAFADVGEPGVIERRISFPYSGQAIAIIERLFGVSLEEGEPLILDPQATLRNLILNIDGDLQNPMDQLAFKGIPSKRRPWVPVSFTDL